MKTPLFKNKRKVLVGFKCSPSLKLTLYNEAKKLDVTLSSFVETIAENHLSDENEIKTLTEEVRHLKEALDQYESSYLKDLFKKYKGQEVTYLNRDDETVTITIEKVSDVFQVIINSFKPTK